jgi:hypothetical protein
MSSYGFRSDLLRRLVDAAEEQKVFELDRSRGKHPALVCLTCGYREIVSNTARLMDHEGKNKIGRLRRHGLLWQGRGGTHNA